MIVNSSKGFFRNEVLILLIIGFTLLHIVSGSIYLCYLLVPLFLIVILNNKDLIDRKLFIIGGFSLLYPISLTFNSNFELLPGSILFGILIFPSIFYLLGKYFIKIYPSQKTLRFLAFFICFTFSLFPFIANLISVVEGGFMSERNVSLLFGNSDDAVNATNMGSFFALNLGLFPLLLLKKENMGGLNLRFAVLYLVGIALFSTLNMSNRTALLITGLSILVYFAATGNKRFFFVTSIVAVIIVILINLDAWGLKSIIQTAKLYIRFADMDLHEELRFQYWKEAIAYLVKHPFGQFSITNSTQYAHNLWIDTALRAGILPMIPLLIFTVVQISDIIFLSRSDSINEISKGIILGFGIAFYVTFFLEPILEGYFIFFMIYFFFSGILSRMKTYPLDQEEHQLIVSANEDMHRIN